MSIVNTTNGGIPVRIWMAMMMLLDKTALLMVRRGRELWQSMVGGRRWNWHRWPVVDNQPHVALAFAVVATIFALALALPLALAPMTVLVIMVIILMRIHRAEKWEKGTLSLSRKKRGAQGQGQ